MIGHVDGGVGGHRILIITLSGGEWEVPVNPTTKGPGLGLSGGQSKPTTERLGLGLSGLGLWAGRSGKILLLERSI